MQNADTHKAWNKDNNNNNSYLLHFQIDSAKEFMKYWLFQDKIWIPFYFHSIVLFLLYNSQLQVLL